ncbi:ATP-binding protein [Ancylobacter defluvii]|uniref:histidine kinase n=1 Tax=Ancylobacter defluvii TaxID=1282440 RepID=A0A9W6K2Z4_9HYPH|nr:ATP-binding protein [Ancylobacter defluvii]MBS7586732.1 hypothetical protein [Ancylobacter defluvii]GLK86033.1 two-component sensor histidine kinase [Ancylobacter defluvii]
MRLGLIARIVLIVAVALFAIQLAVLALSFGLGGGRETVGPGSPGLPLRIASLVRLIDGAPAGLRPAIIEAFSDNAQAISILPALPPDTGRSADLARIAQAIRAALALGGTPGREVVAQFDGSGDGEPGDRLRLIVQLASGDYLSLNAEDRVTVRLLGIPIGFFAGLFGLLVAIAALIAVAREMRPLIRLARDVDRIGEQFEPLALNERGAPEVRSLIRAVNAMQQRIANLVKNRSLTLGAISHDLRTYLTRLRLRVEMMPEGRHRAGAIADVEAMQAFVEDALDFAEASFAAVPPADCDLAGLLRRYRTGNGEAGRIALDLPEGPVTVAVDGKALERVCTNLVENALRYGGAAFLHVEQRAAWVVLTIDDPGPGIPAEERTRVFEPFFRLEASRSRESGGAGLGLTIVKRIVERHGGRIELGDSVRGGLCVRVELPAGGPAA